MNKEHVKISKTLFAAYTGLTASGYDMADCSDKEVKVMIDSIRKVVWSDDVMGYFSKARTDRCKVNPYWPMASMLSIASLRMQEDSLTFNDKDALVDFFKSLSNISPEEKCPVVLEWILMLPDILVKVVQNPYFDAIWSNYQAVVTARSEGYENILAAACEMLLNTLGISRDEFPCIYFIPNLLQAPHYADYEVDDRSIGIIQNIPGMMSVVHEVLHILLKPYKDSIRNGLKNIPVDIIADMDKMKVIGYAWNNGEESLDNITEESFVRATSLWVGYKDDIAEADKIAHYYSEDGFTIVPALLQCLRSRWEGCENIEKILTEYFKGS